MKNETIGIGAKKP